MTKTSTERRPRSPRVTLRLAEDHYAFACEMAKRRGYLGPGEYLRSVLRMAILIAMDEEALLLEAAAMPADRYDLDDEIPF